MLFKTTEIGRDFVQGRVFAISQQKKQKKSHVKNAEKLFQQEEAEQKKLKQAMAMSIFAQQTVQKLEKFTPA